MGHPTPPQAASALTAARVQLASLTGELARFLAGSEAVFLEIASRLQSLERQASRVAEEAGSAVTFSFGHDADDPVEHLCARLGKLEEHLRASREVSCASIAPLSRMLESLEALVKSGPEFRRHAQTLGVLGVNLHVENARVNGQQVGMETVAGDVRRLSELVRPRFDALLAQARGLRDLAASARAATQHFLGSHGGSSEKLLEEVRGDMVSMRSLAHSAVAIARNARAASQQIAACVARVLVSLQFHDVTRQMIEHVVEELESFEREMSDAPGTATTEARLAHLSVLCRLEAAQLRGAREKLAQALQDIARDLRTIGDRATDLGQSTRQLAGDGTDAAPLVQLNQEIAGATRTFRSHLEHEEKTGVAVERVSQTVQRIAAGLRDIETIGIDVKIIALNALVKTAKLGAQGRVLAVLAAEVSTLSVGVVSSTQAVSVTLREIASVGATLHDAERAAQIAEGRQIASGLEEVVRSLTEFQGQLETKASSLSDGSAALGSEVARIVEQLAAQQETAGSLQRVERELERTAESTARLAGTVEVDRARCLSSAYSRYTMETERVVHRGIARPGPVPLAASKERGGDMGSNVELF